MCCESGDTLAVQMGVVFYSRGHGWLLLVSVERMMNERKELCDKIERLQTQVNDLKVAKCVLEENLLSGGPQKIK